MAISAVFYLLMRNGLREVKHLAQRLNRKGVGKPCSSLDVPSPRFWAHHHYTPSKCSKADELRTMKFLKLIKVQSQGPVLVWLFIQDREWNCWKMQREEEAYKMTQKTRRNWWSRLPWSPSFLLSFFYSPQNCRTSFWFQTHENMLIWLAAKWLPVLQPWMAHPHPTLYLTCPKNIATKQPPADRMDTLIQKITFNLHKWVFSLAAS